MHIWEKGGKQGKPVNLIEEVTNSLACFNGTFILVIEILSKGFQSNLLCNVKIISQFIEIDPSNFFNKVVHGLPPPGPFQKYLNSLHRIITPVSTNLLYIYIKEISREECHYNIKQNGVFLKKLIKQSMEWHALLCCIPCLFIPLYCELLSSILFKTPKHIIKAPKCAPRSRAASKLARDADPF